jgi:hypothetical protein
MKHSPRRSTIESLRKKSAETAKVFWPYGRLLVGEMGARSVVLVIIACFLNVSPFATWRTRTNRCQPSELVSTFTAACEKKKIAEVVS